MDANQNIGETPARQDASAAGKHRLTGRVMTALKKLLRNRPARVLSFEELYGEESRKLGNPVVMQKGWVATGAGGEPWVRFTPRDRFGLALSGGGIRSATFNLGFLQSLDQLGVLKHVDYLATVSGGGYVGGFWTAWLLRNQPKADGKKFPVPGRPGSGESAEVRHLREFSRFLLPRVRVLGTEFWGMVMVVVGGVLPSLVSALAVLAFMWFGWVMLLAFLLAEDLKLWRVWAVLALLCANFIVSETWHQILRRPTLGGVAPDWRDRAGYWAGAALGCALIVKGWFWWRRQIHSQFTLLATAHQVKIRGFATLNFPEKAFEPALLITAVTLLMLIIRVPLVRLLAGLPWLAGFERAVTRVLRLAAVLLAMAVLWQLASAIEKDTMEKWFAGGGWALSTGLFLWARKWLSEPPKETQGGNLLQLAFTWLKRATPKVLALITWVLLFVLVGAGVEGWLQTWLNAPENSRELIFWSLPGGIALLAGLMILLFDPERMGMHELYRSRISRCYLGASNQAGCVGVPDDAARAAANRATSERADDDLTMAQLAGVNRPLHLVCTTANDLSGDPVGTLYRGAKSAVLSVHGISLGNQTAELDKLSYSSALTASAAAFNSQMGRFSMDYGPAVTFLMSAFNLRLGLWVPHPDNRRRGFRLPGRFFFCELLGLSGTEGRNLLLSDGGHFENFGLYELIRRHCRYIIVSDCGADPEVAFDDLANVLRRVREDFGVEVELDVSRLNPGADGLAGQHAVVGTIHYNGLGGLDKGTLLFIKPALTGDEPPDVFQYHARNSFFPQESTANQFYDEPQWESYRRLGEHTGRMVLAFRDRPLSKATDTVDNIFRDASSLWYPMPENLSDRFIDLSARCAEFEENLTSAGPALLRREFFSEAAELAGLQVAVIPAAGPEPKPHPAESVEEDLKVLGFLIRAIQIMEDVWVAVDLEHYWSHPLNEGWMNYFHRWAATPSFRRWWPVLAPIFSLGFRSFVQERFAVGAIDAKARPAGGPASPSAELHLSLIERQMDYQDSHAWRCFLQHRPEVQNQLADKKVFGYALKLLNRDGVSNAPGFWVGFALVSESAGGESKTVVWRAEHFFVPPMLRGGGIVSKLLDAVIRHYKPAASQPAVKLQVRFDELPPGTSPASSRRKSQGLAPAARFDRLREIEFYKSRGFQYHRPEDPKTGAISLHLRLAAR